MQLGTCRWRAQLINPWTASRQATAQLAMCRRAVLACAGRGVALAAAPTPAPGPRRPLLTAQKLKAEEHRRDTGQSRDAPGPVGVVPSGPGRLMICSYACVHARGHACNSRRHCSVTVWS